jgi:hypothetical protein
MDAQVLSFSKLSKAYHLTTDDLKEVSKAQEAYDQTLKTYSKKVEDNAITEEDANKIREASIRLTNAQTKALDNLAKKGKEAITFLKQEEQERKRLAEL